MALFNWRQWFWRALNNSRRRPHKARNSRPLLEALEERDVPSITASGQSLTFTEGTSLSATVATFTDTTPSPAASYTASIDWGDGSTTTADSVSLSGGTLSVTGSHTYADETAAGAPSSIKVTITETANDQDTATATGSATVADAPLHFTGGGIPPVATEGGRFNASATFTDDNPLATTADFTAGTSLDWGDGTSDVNDANISITGGNGTFTVTGSHTYDEGHYTVKLHIQDDGGMSIDLQSQSPSTVRDATLSANPVDIAPNEGTPFGPTVVATFTDGNPLATTADFTAGTSIDWGDGSLPDVNDANISITGGNGTFTVLGSHTYADDGNYTVRVSILDDGGSSSTALSTAAVAEGDLAVTGSSFSATEGVAFTGQKVATFTDAGSPDAADAYTATIDWGDGSPATLGSISGSGGTFTVTGNHTYTDEATFDPIVTVTETGVSTGSSSATGTATVAEGDTLTASSIQPTLTATEGSSTGLVSVAMFTDTGYPGNPASDFTATIDWGDGTAPSTGTVSSDGAGNLTVSGSHTYAEDGNFPVTVVLSDDAPGTATATATSLAVVPNSGITGSLVGFAATEFSTFSGAVATFTDPGGNAPASAFTATIFWGDGTVSTGTVSGSGGHYTVSGSHLYTDEGSRTVSVLFTKTGISNGTALASAPITVLERALPPGNPEGPHGTQNERFISELYDDLLGRPVDLASLRRRTRELGKDPASYHQRRAFLRRWMLTERAVRRLRIALGLPAGPVSAEAIQAYFLHFLDRPASPQELTPFFETGLAARGHARVLEAILSSQEYFARIAP